MTARTATAKPVNAETALKEATGGIRACYLNDNRSCYTGVLRSLFGPCGGRLFYRYPDGPGRFGLYVCGHHVRELSGHAGRTGDAPDNRSC